MKLAFLKKVRIILSLLFFVFTLFVFIDFTGILGAKVIQSILYLQFFPSLLEFLKTALIASAGFLFILAVTLLFGRVYCSSVCPLGTIMDISTRLSLKMCRKPKFRYRKHLWIPRFGILAVAILLLVLNNLFILNLLDPFGISGRIFSGLFRPAWYTGNNLLAGFLKIFDNYTLYPVPVKFISLSSVLVSLLFLAAIVVPAVFRGRWYCNVICPVGSLLGLFSRFSLFRLQIDRSRCTACGICTNKCKAECIDFKKYKIDFSRCIACYNCIGDCPEGGINYDLRLGGKRKEEKIPVPQSESIARDPVTGIQNRRDFFKTGIAGAAGLALAQTGFSKAGTQGVSMKPVTPPGSVSIWNYTAKCVSCNLCVSICPTRVLQPTIAEFGMTGLFQPKMDFHTNFCNFECVICTEICPTGAILPVTKEQKETLQMGISKFIKNICIVVEKKTTCGACSEHCPTKAVEMVPYLGELKIPAVNEKICVGCGACEYACPTKPDKAIYVESNLYHRKAMKPLKKIEDKEEKKQIEDFPF
jgi:ferredoxin